MKPGWAGGKQVSVCPEQIRAKLSVASRDTPRLPHLRNDRGTPELTICKLLLDSTRSRFTLAPPHEFLNEWISITTMSEGFVLQDERVKNLRFRKLPWNGQRQPQSDHFWRASGWCYCRYSARTMEDARRIVEWAPHIRQRPR